MNLQPAADECSKVELEQANIDYGPQNITKLHTKEGKMSLLQAPNFRTTRTRKRADFMHIFVFISTIILIAIQNPASSTSINYGISQQPITDINQLMPKLCQNQSVICEGSFCIPGVRKCVCDLRMPVQFGRFCLRQVDIETRCFVTNQCNHTIKDAVCTDINSNAILDADSSRFKLEQWQHLNELRQLSAASSSNKIKEPPTTQLPYSNYQARQPVFMADDEQPEESASIRTYESSNVVFSMARNSPYEINYNTPELLQQNHTRRKQNNPNRMIEALNITDQNLISFNQTSSPSDRSSQLPEFMTIKSTTTQETPTTNRGEDLTSTSRAIRYDQQTTSISPNVDENVNKVNYEQISTTTVPTTTSSSSEVRRKTITKAPNWPPGVCSCPFGFMFDSMLRKCLALSLADSHCQTDTDCKQIALTHCGPESKKCECDEPLVWNQTLLSCDRPKPRSITNADGTTSQVKEGLIENLLPPLIMAKLLPDQSVLLLIFVIIVIIATLIILKLTLISFSSSGSVLISPKNKKKRHANNGASSLVPPKSPYATLRRPEHKPSSQLSNFTQATRGRILNYDFEQEGPITSDVPPTSDLNTQTLRHSHSNKVERPQFSTMGRQAKPNKQRNDQQASTSTLPKKPKGIARKESDEHTDSLVELNDNISVSQMEVSENKSDNSILTIPGPPVTQPPPYMLASAMKGQGSAIAAAAAAVANKRMQRNNIEQQTSAKMANGHPVYL